MPKSWAGLEKEDFELVTTYENSRHCKPNPEYYRDIIEAIGVRPEECLINKEGKDIDSHPNGDFAKLREYIDSCIE